MDKYQFKAKCWKFRSKGGWHFITVPKALSKKIRKSQGFSEEGWGRLKTTAQIGKTKWETAIWFDTKHDAYLLPVKSLIRKKEKIDDSTPVKVSLQFKEPDKKSLGWLVKL